MNLWKAPRAHVDQGGFCFGENPMYLSVYKNDIMSGTLTGKNNKKSLGEQ